MPTLPTAHEFPKGFAVPAPKTRLEEALSRPNEPPASGCNAPARGGGSDSNTASGDNAPASGISEPETAVVNPGVENTAGLDLENDSSDDEVEPDPRRDLRAEAISTKHLLTRQPKNQYVLYSKACTRCKMQPTPCRRCASSGYGAKPEKFGDICTCDHIIAYDELSKGVNCEQEALVLVDIATGWMFGYPIKTKSAKDVVASVIDFSPLREIKRMHS